MLTADLDKEIQETQVEEKNAQEEYEAFLADSAAKRAADATSIAEKTAAKADLAANLEKMTGEKKTKMTEAMAKAESIKDLHLECDWLLSNFELRKEAASGEDILTKTYQLANSPYVVGRHGGENRAASVERAARKRDADSEPLDRLSLGGLGMHDGEDDAVQSATGGGVSTN